MRLATTASAFLSTAALAAPTSKPGPSSSSDGDGTTLNYALALERMQLEYFTQGVKNFTQDDFAAQGFDEDVYLQVDEISRHEEFHVNYLESALQELGTDPVGNCTYNFGVADPKSFLATAQVIEGLTVSAYLGIEFGKDALGFSGPASCVIISN